MTATTEAAQPVFRCESRKLELRVGDEVGVEDASVYGPPPKIHTVVKVTHKGRRVRLDDGREFNDEGRRCGERLHWGVPTLMSADKARRLADPKLTFKAFDHTIGELRGRAMAILNSRHPKAPFAPLTDDERRDLLAIIDRM